MAEKNTKKEGLNNTRNSRSNDELEEMMIDIEKVFDIFRNKTKIRAPININSPENELSVRDQTEHGSDTERIRENNSSFEVYLPDDFDGEIYNLYTH